jgi:hypothetical protein
VTESAGGRREARRESAVKMSSATQVQAKPTRCSGRGHLRGCWAVDLVLGKS